MGERSSDVGGDLEKKNRIFNNCCYCGGEQTTRDND